MKINLLSALISKAHGSPLIPPKFLTDSLLDVAKSNNNQFHQYTRPAGHIPLVKLIAERYSKHLKRSIDPLEEVSITVGASQALFIALSILLKEDDEIVLFEPFFDLYEKQIRLTGAKVVYVPLGFKSDNPGSDI